jgi:hypothetical protein
MPRRFRNTRRENRLEELGRVDAERAHTSKGKRNLREEKDRIRSELKSGGRPATRPMTPDQKRKPRKPKGAGPSAPSPRKKFKTHGGGPDAGNIGKLKDAISKARKGLGKTVSPAQPDLSQIKKHMKKYKTPLRKGGSAKKPRPHGPHMWVKGDRVKKRGGGLSHAQQHYVQHGYGPHKSSGKVLKGKKIGIQIK